jgi:SanA protein
VRRKRPIGRWILSLLGVSVGLVILLNHWVINNTEAYVYNDWSLLPTNDVGLVLGTSTRTRNGEPNPQFYSRIQAAVQLYQLGKIKHLLVSGSNPDATYNEPRAMWRELTKQGIPQQAITMDFAGLRTFDSVTRAQVVFGVQRVTVITQRYHAYRAVFIGKKEHMDIYAYAAPGDDDSIPLRQQAREWIARVKAILDIYVLQTTPKFLGEQQPIDAQ